MGVRGLTTYINRKQDSFLQDFLLHNCDLVIDGNSLCAQLYRSLNCFSAFGGDYDKFANYVRNFFKSLKKCHITPYVLFDGSYEKRKLKTAYSRLRSKIYGASKLDPVTQASMQIFPLLIRDVFKQVLSDMNVLYTVCEFEADNEIAAMARRLNCPVLSYDSDFFIYNVLYIPFNTLDFKPTPVDIDGTKTLVLECKIFKVENITTISKDLLPLLATLLGNDFVKKQVFRKFFSQLKMPKIKKKTNEQQKSIHGLFLWLQNETLETAISKILGRLKKQQKDKVLYIIKRSMEGYNSTHCRSLKYFGITDDSLSETNWHLTEEFEETLSAGEEEEDIENQSENGEESSSENDEQNSEEVTDNDDDCEPDTDILGLPEWFAEGIRHNHIPHSFINLYTNHLHFCSPQAEDYTETDSFIPCLPIMRYAFDLLTDFSEDTFCYVSRENSLSYRRIFVDEEMRINRPFDEEFCQLNDVQLRSCFNHFLKEKMPKLDLEMVNLLPENFQLFFLALLFWIKYCDVPLANVHSLFICYIMLEVIDEKTGTFRGHHHFNNKYSKKIEELKKIPVPLNTEENELFLNKNKVTYEDSLLAASVLLKHFELSDKIKKKPKSYDSRRMHSFAQFQCCLQQFNCLNILCKSPFASTKYYKSFSGTFVYNIAEKLENQTDPKAWFPQYIKGATTVLQFYNSLCNIYEKCAEQMGLVTAKWMAGSKRRRRKNAIEKEIDFIVKGFESEVYI